MAASLALALMYEQHGAAHAQPAPIVYPIASLAVEHPCVGSGRAGARSERHD
jgi:hypothetical protein